MLEVFAITDRLTLGISVGVVSQMAKYILELVARALGLAMFTDVHVAAGVFLNSSRAASLLGHLIGLVGTLAISVMWAILLVYLLTATGKDHWSVKGLSTGLVAWAVGWGIFAHIGFSQVKPVDYGSALTALVLYLGWGWLVSYLTVRWADDGLFRGTGKLT